MTTDSKVDFRDAFKRSLLKITTLQSQIESLENAASEPIAIVGMGCRFPGGATDVASYWNLLFEGKDAIGSLERRWELIGSRPTNAPSWAGLIDDVEMFDAEFFGINPREAASLDPQQRMVLEVAWHSLEDAGILPSSLNRSQTGVFIGAYTLDYLAELRKAPPETYDIYAGTGNAMSFISGRLSYLLGLQGPCFTVDTACSSSLVAIHLACQALRNRECNLALAGGVNLLLSPDTMDVVAKLQALSPDGRCHTFDASANGFVRGEGVGMLVLKRLSDASRDKDRIWAVIRGSAVNQDGRSPTLTSPNGLSQQALITEVLSKTKLSPERITFVECHGTGTPLGDPIEVSSLREVLGAPRADGAKCLLGSVKTNVGHLEAAAGVAGLIKVALALHHKTIPRLANFQKQNPLIDLSDSCLALATETTPWASNDTRIAGVSAFGLSGTNTHMIVEEANESPAGTSTQTLSLLFLSAHPGAIRDMAEKYAEHLEKLPSLPDVCLSAVNTRERFKSRLAIVARDSASAAATLRLFAAEGTAPHALDGEAGTTGKIAFLFTGQGSQRPGMGRELSEKFPTFRAAIEACFEGFNGLLPVPLRDVMWAVDGSPQALLLEQTQYTQAALFSLEYALYALWSSLGIEPDYLIGHSIGELVAACVAGVFSLESAFTLVAARGRLMQSLPAGGAMLSVEAPEEKLLALTEAKGVSLAAVNSLEQCVLSGDEVSIAELEQRLESEGVSTKRLQVSHAFHSPLMEPILEEFTSIAEQITYHPPQKKLISNISGKLAGEEMTRGSYWAKHIRETVRFSSGIKELQAAGVRTFIECGPKAILLGFLPSLLEDTTTTTVASLRAKRPEQESMLSAIGALAVLGLEPNWSKLFTGQEQIIRLPSYPFQRSRYWHSTTTQARNLALQDLLGDDGLSPEEKSSIEKLLASRAAKGSSAANGSLSERLRELDEEQRTAALRGHITSLLAKLLYIEKSKLDTSRHLASLGADSLQMASLRTELSASLGREIPAGLLLANTIDALITSLAKIQ